MPASTALHSKNSLHRAILPRLAVWGGASRVQLFAGETIHQAVSLFRLTLNVPRPAPLGAFCQAPLVAMAAPPRYGNERNIQDNDPKGYFSGLGANF